MKIIVTGGAGFIGSNLVRLLLSQGHHVCNVDKLTYAGNLQSLEAVQKNPNYCFEKVDICDSKEIARLIEGYAPDALMHLAAETHVDRSIDGSEAFIRTNVLGTYCLLEVARKYWSKLPEGKKSSFRFMHISTDEVFGDLAHDDECFSETTSYAPSSPYSASKASSDHLVRAWHRTYGLPVLITNCSNNYGPNQFPEKLIPLILLNAVEGKALPVYGDGKQIRDWLYVGDHVEALVQVLMRGKMGETYNVGGNNEMENIAIINEICLVLEELLPNKPKSISKYCDLITYVDDRPGHDRRYAINAGKIKRELGWSPKETFASGIRKTIQWYLENLAWCAHVQEGNYQRQRLGIKQ